VDRSPTGTGISGRLALHYAGGEIQIGQPIKIESIIGSSFTGKVIETTQFGPYEAIIPEVEGSAYITGRHEFLLDPQDPLKEGFFLR
jgi:trans-L-3-hydroxyproline dehydratase